jgi:hypothetical protein
MPISLTPTLSIAETLEYLSLCGMERDLGSRRGNDHEIKYRWLNSPNDLISDKALRGCD